MKRSMFALVALLCVCAFAFTGCKDNCSTEEADTATDTATDEATDEATKATDDAD